MEQEPMPLCSEHPRELAITVAAKRCPECRRTTNSAFVMCGFCATERGICVLDGHSTDPAR
jgi:hypothetical protein